MKWSVLGHERVKRYYERALGNDAPARPDSSGPRQNDSVGLDSGGFSHAYVLTGPNQIGKRALAREAIAAAHGGATAGVNDPYTVLIAPDEKGTISVQDHIRPMIRALALRPPEVVRVFVVIDDAERMTRVASDALLKALEEPPSYVTFMLVTSSSHEMPATIISRCRELRHVPADDAAVRTFLSQRCAAKVHHDALLRLSGGALGWLSSCIEKNEIPSVIAASIEFEKGLKQGIAQRLIWAKQLSDRDDIREWVYRWMHLVRATLREEPYRKSVADALIELHDTLGQSKYSTRLALERFVLKD